MIICGLFEETRTRKAHPLATNHRLRSVHCGTQHWVRVSREEPNAVTGPNSFDKPRDMRLERINAGCEPSPKYIQLQPICRYVPPDKLEDRPMFRPL